MSVESLFHSFEKLRKCHIHSINKVEECDECNIFITSLKSLHSIKMCFWHVTEFSLSQSIVNTVIPYEACNIFKSLWMVIWNFSFWHIDFRFFINTLKGGLWYTLNIKSGTNWVPDCLVIVPFSVQESSLNGCFDAERGDFQRYFGFFVPTCSESMWF